MLGHRLPNGGTTEHQKRRLDVLDRIRAVSHLTIPQAETWTVFRRAWDEKRRYAENLEWGRVFAEETQQLLNDMHNGSKDVVSKWMESERKRILSDVQCLIVPAIEFA